MGFSEGTPAPLNFIEFGDGTRAKGNVQNHVSH